MQRIARNQTVVLRRAVVGHLLAAVDEALLHRRDALLLLDLFLDLRDLDSRVSRCSHRSFSECEAYLVVHLDVEFDLLAGQCSHSGYC